MHESLHLFLPCLAASEAGWSGNTDRSSASPLAPAQLSPLLPASLRPCMHDMRLSSDKNLTLKLCCIRLSENLWFLQSCTQSQCSLGGCVHLSVNTATTSVHPLMHVAIYSLPGATCAAKTQSRTYCIAGNVQPLASVEIKRNVHIGTDNIDSPLFHIPFCICRTTTTPPTATPLTPTRAAPALEAAALSKCCSIGTKLQVW